MSFSELQEKINNDSSFINYGKYTDIILKPAITKNRFSLTEEDKSIIEEEIKFVRKVDIRANFSGKASLKRSVEVLLV